MAKQLILCDCSGSQQIDADGLSKATGLVCSKVHTALCTSQIGAAAQAIQAGDAVIACQQEAQRFEELAAELSVDAPLFVDIRDRAGWSDGADTTAKMSALVSESLLPAPAVKTIDVTSQGACLVVGKGAVVLPVADALAGTLAVTVLLTDDAEPPLTRAYEVVRGTQRRATGTMGQFSVRIDALQILEPAGRGSFTFSAPRDGAETQCDVIVDLSGQTSLFPAPHKRDGYLRADPGSQPAVAEVTRQASELIGTFEKTLYLSLETHLCAHSRAGQTGCTRCLDICPTGAILTAGDHVDIDPLVCAGCGACSALCPSGAIKYDALPFQHTLTRLRTLAEAYAKAGGTAPRLLVHDDTHGAEMISLAARFDRGLPADVIPVGVSALTGFGHAEILAALTFGFASVQILPGPKTERDPVQRELDLANAMGADGRASLLDVDTPDGMSAALYDSTAQPVTVTPKLLMGDRRQVARVAAKALIGNEDMRPLPAGAPYGATVVNTDTCTLCLSCVSLCPSGALVDNPDKPELRFQEDACLQCGICTTICPEQAITLQPRFNPTDEAMKLKTLNEEEPFCCIECSKPFGVKSTVEKIMEKLTGKHAMFQEGGAGRLIQMCDDCRVKAQFHGTSSPFQMGERPQVRTTDDYLSKRRDH
ncbi:MAG: 4Fe-4S dicluster domain-containing protein [Pseudomonadota bacterium]|nr:4Fe-4S dicluster domain-containing protein [Pseudomonadota bacterium]